MKKTIMMLAAFAMIFGMTACSDDDDDDVKDLGQAVAGSYTGQTTADFAYAKGYVADGESTTVTVSKVSTSAVNVAYNSSVWGTADFSNVVVSENDTAYVFTAPSTQVNINMPDMHNGGTVNQYPATLESGYVLKNGNRSKFQFKLNVPSVMGGLTLTFAPNN